jgi:hypothetical protein
MSFTLAAKRFRPFYTKKVKPKTPVFDIVDDDGHDIPF